MNDILFKTRGDRDWKILEDLGHGNAVACVLQRSRRLQDLLRFFVEERIAYGDRPVPQQRLAEEVLGKGADFSPTSNPHVRIYLRRLRQRVATSYAGPGAADPLVLGVTCVPYRLSVECRRRADAPVTKAPRLKATPNMVVLITDLAASGLDGELHLLPSLVSRSLVPYLLGQDGIVAIGPVPRQRITQPAWQSPVVRSSVADCLLDGVMTVGSAAPDGKRTVEIVIRLYDIETGGHVWSRSWSWPGRPEAVSRNAPSLAIPRSSRRPRPPRSRLTARPAGGPREGLTRRKPASIRVRRRALRPQPISSDCRRT
jgi:hypothetical protein